MRYFKMLSKNNALTKLIKMGYKQEEKDKSTFGAYIVCAGGIIHHTSSMHYFHDLDLPVVTIENGKLIEAVSTIKYDTEIVNVINESIGYAAHVSLYNSTDAEDMDRIKKLKEYMPVGSKLRITIELIRNCND